VFVLSFPQRHSITGMNSEKAREADRLPRTIRAANENWISHGSILFPSKMLV
jgi:hypothetical protein